MNKNKIERVVILGASDNPERYSYKAFKMLGEYGHERIPVSPKLKNLEGVPVKSELKEVRGAIDTLTMYVGPAISTGLSSAILELRPKRVIFNPGSESPTLQKQLQAAGITTLEACTLVMLRTKQF